MINNQKILVVVPARGGSRGIRLKNLIQINGVPLVAIVGHIVKELSYIDRAIVSTDHQEIARVAKEAGLDVPFYRPKELSGDYISDVEVLAHALIAMEDIDKTIYDIIVMLQPTSPLRKPEHVTDTVVKLIDGGYDAVWTISKTDPKNHPLKQLCFDNEQLDYYDLEGSLIIARQQLSQLYHRNGAAYAISRDCLLGKKSIKGDRTSAIIIDEIMVSIDNVNDLEYILTSLNLK